MNTEEILKNRCILEISKHLEAACDLFDTIKHLDPNMILKTVGASCGRCSAHLEYKAEEGNDK